MVACHSSSHTPCSRGYPIGVGEGIKSQAAYSAAIPVAMLWRIAAFAALGGFLFGYDLGVMVREGAWVRSGLLGR